MKYKKLLLRQYTLQEYQPIIEHLYLECLYQLENKELDKYYKRMVSEDEEEEIRELYFLKLINLLKDFPNETKNRIRKNISESLVVKLREEMFMDTEMIITLMCKGQDYEDEYDEENHELIESEIKEEIEYFSAIGMIANGTDEDDEE